MKELLYILFSQHHIIDVAEISKLSKKDIDILGEMVLGMLKSPNRIKAFDIYSATTAPDKVEVLIKVLYNREENIPVRAAAVYHLGHIGGPEVEQALITCLTEESNQLLQAKIVKNIGFSGSEKAIPALRRLEEKSEGYLKQQTTFALLVIGHRLGLKDFIPLVPNENKFIQPGHGMAAARLKEVEEKKYPALNQLLAGEMYSLNPNRKIIGEYKCAGRELVLLLNDESVITKSPGVLTQRPNLLGALALWSEESSRYSVYRWILTGPSSGDRFYIAIYKASGLLMHYGWANIKEGVTELELRSLNTLGNAAIDIKAVIENANLSFERFMLSPVISSKKVPRKYHAK